MKQNKNANAKWYTYEIGLTKKQINTLLAILDSYRDGRGQGSSPSYRDCDKLAVKLVTELHKGLTSIEQRENRDAKIRMLKEWIK